MPEIEILKYAFMQRALVTGLATALVCGLLSCWITHMGWSLMGDAISHSILPGVVISHLVGLPYLIGALVFALITVILVGQVKKSQIHNVFCSRHRPDIQGTQPNQPFAHPLWQLAWRHRSRHAAGTSHRPPHCACSCA